ncbi:hypothetical protein [Turicibacter sanguinis]|uniref:hypothetical protein n=1 Tax=Turicibacter sanguinis TaxID=154288 RepID=UPI00232BD402|nr:hypothetical protein [Turicibacter sanguinis]MDB8575180.1 hypothetical protein [Turicibacter sanguinis]MDB8577279.1 hypothetical protein [Turicibacter sanguinis]MDB8583823.1 hypothetical protein [Turicibacter sanguinis]MDB8586607.1 hypothetical protein [Turicibacter sanguinis]MDB8597543.1 hypothetical protein [Turicibacter sanguinis]
MKVNSPLGIVEIPDVLAEYGFTPVGKNPKKLCPQEFHNPGETLWYRGSDGRARTSFTPKDLPRNTKFSCSCGYEVITSLEHIKDMRCHKCSEIMMKSSLDKVEYAS